ncbi:MAG: M48 family metallopeptidase [Bacteroidales bacterium]|nr:M48 family metallopeptidase [Bacteroidales bacterium]
METAIYYLIIGIVILDFLFEGVLDYLNMKHFSPIIPNDLEGIYEPQKYKKSQDYLLANSKVSMISSTIMFLALIVVLLVNGFAWLDTISRTLSPNLYLRTIIFFGILGLASTILSLPFEIYSTFVVEEKFEFNKTTTKTFVIDKIKSLLLGLILGGGVLLFIQWAYIKGGHAFWIITILGIGLIMIFMAMFYTSLIVPLFNKLQPLEDGPLKTAIQTFADKTGFTIRDIYVMNGSKRSTKANAYFSGLGPKKKIILYDTLIDILESDEIVSVLAHEIGHYKKKHIYKGLGLSFLQLGIMLFLLWWTLGNPVFSLALGAKQGSFYLGLLAFGILYTPISFLLGIVMNIFSRKHEYQADNFAAQYKMGGNLIESLIKLSESSLSNLTPHPAYVFFNYSHPTLIQRRKAIKERLNQYEEE